MSEKLPEPQIEISHKDRAFAEQYAETAFTRFIVRNMENALEQGADGSDALKDAIKRQSENLGRLTQYFKSFVKKNPHIAEKKSVLNDLVQDEVNKLLEDRTFHANSMIQKGARELLTANWIGSPEAKEAFQYHMHKAIHIATSVGKDGKSIANDYLTDVLKDMYTMIYEQVEKGKNLTEAQRNDINVVVPFVGAKKDGQFPRGKIGEFDAAVQQLHTAGYVQFDAESLRLKARESVEVKTPSMADMFEELDREIVTPAVYNKSFFIEQLGKYLEDDMGNENTFDAISNIINAASEQGLKRAELLEALPNEQLVNYQSIHKKFNEKEHSTSELGM